MMSEVKIVGTLKEGVTRRQHERGFLGTDHVLFPKPGAGYGGLFHLGTFVKMHT